MWSLREELAAIVVQVSYQWAGNCRSLHCADDKAVCFSRDDFLCIRRNPAREIWHFTANLVNLAANGGGVGDDAAVGVGDWLNGFNLGGAGDGLDGAFDLAVEVCGGLGGFEIVGADFVDEAAVWTVAAGVADEHLAGALGDLGDGTIAKVDEMGRNEEEKQDERDHDVVVEAATLVGPEKVVAQEAQGWGQTARPWDANGWRVMRVWPPM